MIDDRNKLSDLVLQLCSSLKLARAVLSNPTLRSAIQDDVYRRLVSQIEDSIQGVSIISKRVASDISSLIGSASSCQPKENQGTEKSQTSKNPSQASSKSDSRSFH